MILLKDAAKALGLSQKAVLKVIDEHGLPSFKLGQQLYLQRKDIDDLLAEKGVVDVQATQDQPVSEMLASAGIFHDVPGLTRTDVLRAALTRIRGIDPGEMGPIFDLFLKREHMGATSVGHGIAMPHLRDVLIGFQPHPLISLAFTQSPIDWDTPDGLPVRAVFTMITPNGQTHMRLLSRLSQLLLDSRCMMAITRQAPAEEILEVFRTAESSLGSKPR